MKMSDLQNLTFENVGSWPLPIKTAAIVLASVGMLGGLYWYVSKPQLEELKVAESREQDLRNSFDIKQRKAANLDALKQQMVDMKESFGDMLRRLPNKTEVAGLLVDISQQGLGAGLEFELFRPGNEVPADFYAELPIQIRVVGEYHEFGKFISGVSDLPRIVTNHNIKIRRKDPKGNLLVMETTAKTYRYLDDEEEGGSP
ncbi:MAG: type 4a pilus biogenesis protein PilO [Gammaproteobacteria bacterium]|nr:type 4a pilus biogenesis protein PilO [Gammaproteobacteria bacterium]